MKNVTLIYLCLFSGVLFLMLSAAIYITENSNLTPVFASIAFSIISISLMLLSRTKNCKSCQQNTSK
ncbi:hypothetical protein tinsulaeT_16060 [Thalassotalea insulae]|uniref:Uncharacterized protein n=1 Tax=Thalassotalea insulae TaxID=2056778 RepID=A0ABQ6GQU1_9GAMM|nr:hypothetical protein tinsulaeT_16060 [Thalassotalea insulae]